MKARLEKISEIAHTLVYGSRHLLITTIMEHAGDEIEGKQEMYDLAIKTDQELKQDLINIINYIKEE